MTVLNLGIGVCGLIILMGILMSGIAAENAEKYSDINGFVELDIDELLTSVDYNVTTQIDDSFVDKNIPASFKKIIHYITRGAIAGFYTSIYLGKAVNDVEPGAYLWIRENMILTVVILILLMCPSIVGTIIICILGLILIIKERFIKKEHKKPKNTWRDNIEL